MKFWPCLILIRYIEFNNLILDLFCYLNFISLTFYNNIFKKTVKMNASKINLNILGIKVQSWVEMYRLLNFNVVLYLYPQHEARIYIIRDIIANTKIGRILCRNNWIYRHYGQRMSRLFLCCTSKDLELKICYYFFRIAEIMAISICLKNMKRKIWCRNFIVDINVRSNWNLKYSTNYTLSNFFSYISNLK